MEKRALIAVALSIAVIAVWQIFFMPTPPAPPKPEVAPQEMAPGPPPSSERSPEGPVAGEPPSAGRESPPAAAIQADSVVEDRLRTDTHDIRFTNEGGRLIWWRLPGYTIDHDRAVDLIPEEARRAGILPLKLEIPDDRQATETLAKARHVHEVIDIAAGDWPGGGPGKRLVFTWSDGRGLSVRKSLDVPASGYLLKLSAEARRDGRPVPLSLVWATGLAQPLEDNTQIYGHVEGQAVVHDGREVTRLSPGDVKAPLVVGQPGSTGILWAGLESTYFASLLLRPTDPQVSTSPTVVIAPQQVPGAAPDKPIPLLTAGVQSGGEGSWELFVGPKDYDLLASLGRDMGRAIDFSRFGLIRQLTRALFLALTWINGYVGNYGWSIILLTVIVRVAFFPLMYKSSITMRQTSKKMTKVAPKVKAIQESYRKTKRTMETQRRMNEEIMALYKKEGVNPMSNLGGCLPLLLQMPIFIAFYNLLAVTIEMRHAPFILWIQDLSRRDPYYITPLLMGASWLLQQLMTSSSIPDPMQRRMMMFMPVMFTFFMMNMPSGLVVYWLTSNVLGMIQQYITNKRADQLDAMAHGGGGSHGRGEATSRQRRARDGQIA